MDNVPTTMSSVSVDDGRTATSWPAYSTSEAVGAKHASASPRQSRRTAKPSNNTPSYNSPNASDRTHQASVLAQAAMNSAAAAKSASPMQSTQYEAAAPTSRSRSRQSMKPQTRTPVSNQPSKPPQRSIPTGAANTSYSTGPDKSTPNYNNTYSQYSANAGQSSNGTAYQPYAQQNSAAATSSSYQNYNSYAARSHDTSNTLPLSNSTAQQQVAPSYSSSAPSTATQWGDASSHTRNPLSYSSSSSTGVSSSVNLRSANPQRSQIPASFNVRPQAPAHTGTRAASTATIDQSQHNVPQTSYSSYSSSQPQQQASSTQQQGWYTGSSTASYGTSDARSSGTSGAGYSAAGSGGSRGGAHYGQQHQQQHQQPHAPAHRAMNLSGHTYSSLDGGKQAIYNMLPGGSGH